MERLKCDNILTTTSSALIGSLVSGLAEDSAFDALKIYIAQQKKQSDEIQQLQSLIDGIQMYFAGVILGALTTPMMMVMMKMILSVDGAQRYRRVIRQEDTGDKEVTFRLKWRHCRMFNIWNNVVRSDSLKKRKSTVSAQKATKTGRN